MEQPVISKKLITVSLILFVFTLVFACGTSLFATGEGRFIQVTLKDNSMLKFECDSFLFNWVTPEVKDEITCDSTAFAISEIDEIRVLNEGLNNCDSKDGDWLFEVVFKDKERRSIQGFIPLSAKEVTGVLFGTTEERTIALENISTVSFQ